MPSLPSHVDVGGEGIPDLYFSLCLTRSHNSVRSLSWHENKQVTSLKIHQLPSIIPTINQAGVETIGALRWSEHPLSCGAGADHRQVAQFSVLFIIYNLFCTQEKYVWINLDSAGQFCMWFSFDICFGPMFLGQEHARALKTLIQTGML